VSSATQTPAGPVRILARVICTRFNAWCVRYLPQRLYLPAREDAPPRAVADAPARLQHAAAPVAPGFTSVISVTPARLEDATGRSLPR
jgi:hypothetical protein